jgi:integrase
VAEILRAAFLGPDTIQNTPRTAACKALIAQAGSVPPQKLSAAHVMEIDAALRAKPYSASTRWQYAGAIRHLLRWLWEYHGAPKLDKTMSRYTTPRPRNVTVRDDERAALLAAAPDHLRLWLLLCSDLAIRSGTAIKLGPNHYDHDRRTLTFTTKCDERLQLSTTDAVDALIAECDMSDPRPFVHQLWARYYSIRRRGHPPTTYNTHALRLSLNQLRKRLGIRRVTLHDHRRTTAVALLEHTHDLRTVQALLGHKNLQSTFWYLDHALRPIPRATLETIKRPYIVARKEQSA